MSGDIVGRSVSISIGGVVVATARTKSLTINNSAINVTADDDAGIQKILDTPGEKSVEVSVDGMRLSATVDLLELSLSAAPTAEIVFTYATYTITGTFFQTSYSESVPYNDAVTFSSSYSSQAAVVKAPV
jgi:predicted secreted protein